MIDPDSLTQIKVYREYPSILDGTQWSIDIEYEGGRKPVYIGGSNRFPYNFNDLLEFLGVDNQDDLDDDEDEV